MDERLAPHEATVALVERRGRDAAVPLPRVALDGVEVWPEDLERLVHGLGFLEVLAAGGDVRDGFGVGDDDLVLAGADDREGVAEPVVQGMLVEEEPAQGRVVDECAQAEGEAFEEGDQVGLGEDPERVHDVDGRDDYGEADEAGALVVGVDGEDVP